MNTVMTIAGLDPSGGAGVLTDIKTITALRCYGVAAITAITSQNTQGVFAIHPVERKVLLDQITPLIDDCDISAVKTGMLPNTETVEVVAEVLAAAMPLHIVVDPVFRSSSGFSLATEESLAATVRLLFPIATLVTPSAAEAGHIAGCRVENEADMETAARALVDMGARAVLVTGGDLKSDSALDLLFSREGVQAFSEKKISSKHTHGTGCTLSSAIACLLAGGFSLPDAIVRAKRYVTEAIRTAPGIGHGRGPLNHFFGPDWQYRRESAR